MVCNARTPVEQTVRAAETRRVALASRPWRPRTKAGRAAADAAVGCGTSGPGGGKVAAPKQRIKLPQKNEVGIVIKCKTFWECATYLTLVMKGTVLSPENGTFLLRNQVCDARFQKICFYIVLFTYTITDLSMASSIEARPPKTR